MRTQLRYCGRCHAIHAHPLPRGADWHRRAETLAIYAVAVLVLACVPVAALAAFGPR
jgi:hypothetical protein